MNQQRVRKKVPIPLGAEGEARIAETLAAEEPTPTEIRDEEVASALEALSSEHRQILLLSDVEEFTYKEIVDDPARAVGTVMSRLSRARSALREKVRGTAAARALRGPSRRRRRKPVTAPLQLRDYACAKVRRRLDSYLAGELSVDLSHEILEHLERCPECRAESDAREKLRASFRRVAGATPGPRDGFEDEVHALLLKTPIQRPMGGLLLAASLILGAGVTGWLVLTRAAGPEASRAVDEVAAARRLRRRLRSAEPQELRASREVAA